MGQQSLTEVIPTEERCVSVPVCGESLACRNTQTQKPSPERSIIIQQLISADKHVYSKLTQTGDKMNQGVSKNVPRLKCADGDCVGLHVFLTVVHWWHIVGVQ